MATLILITSAKAPSRELNDWVSYHLELGIGRIHIYIHDLRSLSDYFDHDQRVHFIGIDDELKKSWKLSPRFSEIEPYLEKYSFLSDSLNVEHCLNHCFPNENDWFLYLPVNEYLRVSENLNLSEHFEANYSTYTQVVVNNFEQIIGGQPGETKKNPTVISDYQLKLFHENLPSRQSYFHSYPIGRSIFRPAYIQSRVPKSLHAFHLDSEMTVEASYFDLMIETKLPITLREFMDFLERGVSEYELLMAPEHTFFSRARETYLQKGELGLKAFLESTYFYTKNELQLMRSLKLIHGAIK